MGWRFQRHVNTSLGRINISKSGISLSEGFKGFHVTIGKTPRLTIGLPGSGLSYTATLPHGRRRSAAPAAPPAPATAEQPQLRSGAQIVLILVGLLAVLAILASANY